MTSFDWAAAAVAIGIAMMGTASATPVPSPNGDPYPSGMQLVYSGGPYTLPGVGTFDSATESNFNLQNIRSPGGPNQTFTYTSTLTVPFVSPPATGIFQGTFEIEIVGRSSLTQTGTFAMTFLSGNFNPAVVNGQTVVATGGLPFPTTVTSATYTTGPSGLLVSYLGTDLPEGFTVNGGPFISTPLGAVSQPLVTTPLPAALPLFGAGLGMVGWLARRRKATAAPVAA